MYTPLKEKTPVLRFATDKGDRMESNFLPLLHLAAMTKFRTFVACFCDWTVAWWGMRIDGQKLVATWCLLF